MITFFNDLDKIKVILFDESNLNLLEALSNPHPIIEDEKNSWKIKENREVLKKIRLKKERNNNYLE